MAQAATVPLNPVGVTRTFLGMNTLLPREAIEDGRHIWLENWMPGGTALLPVAAPETPTLTPTGGTVSRLFPVNISGTLYLLAIYGDGTAYYYNLTSGSPTATKFSGAVTLSTPDISQWQNSLALIADPTAGYYIWNGSDNLGAGGSTQITATKYSYVATYQGRVWLANVATTGPRTYVSTAPGTYNDFSTVDGAVAAVIYQAELRSSIVQLVSNADYLYVFGDNSVWYIANVQANGAHTLLPVSVVDGSFGYGAATQFNERAAIYIAQDGLKLLASLNIQSMSDQIAPTFKLFSGPTNTTLAHINGVLCTVSRVTYADPALGNRNLYVCQSTLNGEIFVASQGNEIWTTSVQLNGVWYTYGTDGKNIYRLFVNSSALIPSQARSKWYDVNGNPVQLKNCIRAGLMANLQSIAGSFRLVLETDKGSGSSINLLTGANLTWTTNNGGVLTFTTNNGGALSWFLYGYNLQAGDPQIRGNWVGYNITGTNPNSSITAVALEYQAGDYWL